MAYSFTLLMSRKPNKTTIKYNIPYISNTITLLYWIWETSFSTRVHRWRPRRHECVKRSFQYSIMLSSFVWHVRYLTCKIIELVNRMNYACFWFFSFLSICFSFIFVFALLCTENLFDMHQGGNYKYKTIFKSGYVHSMLSQ